MIDAGRGEHYCWDVHEARAGWHQRSAFSGWQALPELSSEIGR